MYAVLVTVEDKVGDVPLQTLVYGPYKTVERAGQVRLNLGEKALSAPGSVDVTCSVIALVRFGLEQAIEDATRAE